MMAVSARTLNEITRQAIEILSKELGVSDTMRFVNQFTSGYGNYTEEREHLFQEQDLEQLISEIRRTSKDTHER